MDQNGVARLAGLSSLIDCSGVGGIVQALDCNWRRNGRRRCRSSGVKKSAEKQGRQHNRWQGWKQSRTHAVVRGGAFVLVFDRGAEDEGCTSKVLCFDVSTWRRRPQLRRAVGLLLFNVERDVSASVGTGHSLSIYSIRRLNKMSVLPNSTHLPTHLSKISP